MNMPIVIGTDGTTSSVAAENLGGWEAAMRRRPLRIVHALAWPWPTFHMPDMPPPDDLEAISLYAQANTLVAKSVYRVQRAHPAVTVRGEVLIGFPAPVLSTASQAAAMVVIGHRGSSRADRLLRGSVATQLTAHAACPVLVNRGRPQPSGNVLLGFETGLGRAAVAIAFEEATLRGVGVDLPSWPGSGKRAATHPTVGHPGMVAEAKQHPLVRAPSTRHRSFLDMTARRRRECAGARQDLIDATTQAQLVVVSARSHGTSSRLFPSITHAALNHADCPVLVVPGHDQAAPK